MSKTVLGGRINVCHSISKLNKDGCFAVIRLLGNVMGLDQITQATTKMFMNYSNNWTVDQMIQFENETKQILSNHSQNCKYHDPQSHNCKSKSNTNMNNILEFPLLRLPIDLITKTSFYLNEKDIFQFECCCRLFYQMINNTSYLNLSNCFKTFKITNKTLNQMSQKQHNFFKYLKAKHVQLRCDSRER